MQPARAWAVRAKLSFRLEPERPVSIMNRQVSSLSGCAVCGD
jgi:hypothetical protein